MENAPPHKPTNNETATTNPVAAVPLNDGEIATPLTGEVDTVKFTEYYLSVRTSLRAFLTTLIFDHAAVDDCLQETCLVLWKKKQPHWTLKDFRKIAFMTARFKALSWLKKNKPAAHLTLSPKLSDKLASQAAESPSTTFKSSHTDRMEALSLCLADLSDDQRAIIEARYDNESNNDLSEVAAQKNRKLPAVYKQLERIRTALRKCVQNRITKLHDE